MYIKSLIVISILLCFVFCTYHSSSSNSSNNNTNRFCDTKGDCYKVDDTTFESVKYSLIIFVKDLINVMYRDDRRDRLIKKFNPDVMYEVYPNNEEGDTSFSINKGEEIGMCIRSGNDFKHIHDINTIKFVFIHELAHVISLSEQHTEEFWKNFKYLLDVSYTNDLMELIDYNIKDNQVEYCGMNITYSPFYDKNITNYYYI